MSNRIEGTDNLFTAIDKLNTPHNRAVEDILFKITGNTEEFSQNAPAGDSTLLLHLDSLGIYGTDIKTLHEDVCQGDVMVTSAVIFAEKYGVVEAGTIRAAIDGSTPLDANSVLNQVQEKYSTIAVGYTPTSDTSITVTTENNPEPPPEDDSTKAAWYWSSTEPPASENPYKVDFSDGIKKTGPVRIVRTDLDDGPNGMS